MFFLGVWCCHFVQFVGHAYGTTQLGSELIGHCHIYIYIHNIRVNGIPYLTRLYIYIYICVHHADYIDNDWEETEWRKEEVGGRREEGGGGRKEGGRRVDLGRSEAMLGAKVDTPLS